MSDRDNGSDGTASGESDSGSSTPNSTSTYRYSHEPYETFQDKVLSLARSLGGTEDVSLQRQRGGSYNRVVIVRINRGGDSVHGIFRIPRFSDVTASPGDDEGEDIDENSQETDTDILDQAAVLQFLQSKEIPAPKLLAFDASAANAIGSPHTLQECSTGVPLRDVYGTMSLREKLSICDALVGFLLSAERIQFPQSGYLCMAKGPTPENTGSYLFSSQGPMLKVDVEDSAIVALESPPRTLADLLARKLQHWHEQEPTFSKQNPVTAMWKRLRELVFFMQPDVFMLKNQPSASLAQSILYHWDLEPRNILVKRKAAEEGWNIDMVIDWDQVLAVPAVLARKPPVWLWDFSDDLENSSMRSDYDGDVDLLEPSRYSVDGGKLSPDDQQVKQHFQDGLIDGLTKIYDGYSKSAYMEEAYGKGRWIRRLARFAFHGAGNSQDLDRFNHLDNDWRAYTGTELPADPVETPAEEQ